MEKFFGCGFLATAKNVKKFLAVAMHGHPKTSPNIWSIYISNCWKFSAYPEFGIRMMISHGLKKLLISNSGGHYRMWLFLGGQSAMTIFPTFDGEKFDIPYFEVK